MEKSTGDRDFKLRSIGKSWLSTVDALSPLDGDADDEAIDDIGEPSIFRSAFG